MVLLKLCPKLHQENSEHVFSCPVASVISRTARFFLVAGIIWKFGAPITRFIDRYFNWLAIGFTVLLIGGFVLVKYVV